MPLSIMAAVALRKRCSRRHGLRVTRAVHAGTRWRPTTSAGGRLSRLPGQAAAPSPSAGSCGTLPPRLGVMALGVVPGGLGQGFDLMPLPYGRCTMGPSGREGL